jgi:hypothetical protein
MIENSYVILNASRPVLTAFIGSLRNRWQPHAMRRIDIRLPQRAIRRQGGKDT